MHLSRPPAPSASPSRPWRRAARLAAAVALGAVTAGCGVAGPAPAPGASGSDAPAAGAPSSAAVALPTALPAGHALYPCTGYGKLTRDNTVETNARGQFVWHVFDAVQVADADGDVDWTLDPYEDEAWRLWLASLRWIGPSIEAAREGDDAAYAVAERIVRDWDRDHAEGWADDHDDLEANTHRLNVLLCLREVTALRAGGEPPASAAWLDRLIVRHAEQNMARYSARHNHGSMENRALLGAGCVLDRPEWRRHAMARAEEDIPYQVDEEGMSSEAAPHYARFNHDLFRDIDTLARTCGEESDVFAERVERMAQVLPHMVDSTGHFWQYGDSSVYPVTTRAEDGAELRYAASDGAEGTAPAERIRAFQAGPVFGRSSWGDPEGGFADEASWMLRGGTGTEVKAHRGDLMQLLYTARGRQVVVDGGHPGSVKDSWRGWADGPTAHNVIHIPTLEEFPGEGPAVLSRLEESPDARADLVAMTQPLAAGGERSRSVLVLTGPDAAVVVDRARIEGEPVRGAEHVVESLWTLPPSYAAERTAPDTVRGVDAAAGEATTLVQVRLDGASVGEDGVALHRGELDPREGGHLHRGHHYPDSHGREDATQVAFRNEGATAGVVSVLVPSGAQDEAGVDAERRADGSTVLTVRGAEGVARVLVPAEGDPSRLD